MQKELNEIVLFETTDKSISFPVSIEHDTVWLTQSQMSELFGKDRTVITRHIANVFREMELEEKGNVQKMHFANSDKPTNLYSLDVIISVGYRVKSKRGVEFRRWANSVLKNYIIKGYAVNHNRMNQLNEVIRIMRRAENNLDTKQVLSVVESYSEALELLDAYDHQNMTRPKGNQAVYVLNYDECRQQLSAY